MSQWEEQSKPATALNRRSLLKAAGAAGTLAMASSSGIWGAVAQEAKPRKGGRFKIGIGAGATSDSIDPATYTNSFMEMFGKTLHGYLTGIDADGKLNGELAESWDVSKDAKTWTFKLRKGVEFHNGKSLSADDVLASINHHRGEQSKSGAKTIVDPIQDIKADGPSTVVFTLKGGNADFPYLLEDFHLAIVPSKDGKADVSGVGAGGYALENIDYGVKASAKRFDNYWKSDAAWFDSFEVLAIHDVTARTNALTTGQIHAMDRVDLKTVHLLQRNNAVEILSIAGTQFYCTAMDCAAAPLDNADVRLALKHAIDRQQLLDTLLHGHGKLGNDHPIGSTNRFFAKDLPQRAYDPDKARFHLKKAGLADLKVSLSAADAAFAGAVDAAEIYQQNAAKAGIHIDVVREPSDGYWDTVWLKKPFYMSYWLGRPTADWMFSQGYAADAAWNQGHWKNPDFNELLKAARSELDDAKRLEMYTKMQSICRDDGGEVIPVFANNVSAVSKKIGHQKIASNWDLDGFRCPERWWFAEA
ncbi:ABC transporter substrate-binding protein [Mesorhizobium sp. M1A.F.Ca.ET.072.01.1.1]|uniref:ABC transporter substrate-binding protein n=1 Tax=Mesorhizobium sp. M1A.F.Ca.ET.072.01.1.1 TaxID=2496753 RepID=UPI000FD60186|nr:ABC transporter substrate-binding protein [Mesorhizobium sp. M1A.F.Ca.ET.072.01.1.1]RUW54074.1 ABC transporter substrate-binding protein [Mesorhizobium sp. M1A.F.Ca.ET.072.01.1.1]TIV04059.1 MAG: ABC transporter substrate-binding protein [Mesorhizobium sp.]